MKKTARILVLMLLAAACCCRCSCDKEAGMDRDFLETGAVGLRVAGQNRFMYDPTTCQLGYNSTLVQFRAGNDTGTEYFTLSCDRPPVQVGQTVKADLAYTRGASVARESGLTFSVEQVRGDKAWLWNSAKKIAVCVQVIR